MLHKINLIESFKEYLIGFKDILNFFNSFKNKVNLDHTFWDLCFHLIVLLFVLGFHSLLLLTRSLYSFILIPTVTHARFLHSYGHLSDSHGRLNMKILICFIGVFVIIVTRVCNV